MAMHRPDAEIQKDILAELKWSPEINETDVGVIVKDGAVTLTGSVPSYAQKSAASETAKRIKGVRAIADEIKVKLPSEMEGTDEAIAERISRIYEWNTQIPGDDIKAEVRDGFVTLSGNVDWEYQRNAAQRLITGIKGVGFILNNISIRKRVSIPNVKNEIVKALHRHASVEANRVSISAVDSTVTLTGSVDSYMEKDLIRNTAWSAPGVMHVTDNLLVAPAYSAAA